MVPDREAPADKQRQGLLSRMSVSLAVTVEVATRGSTTAESRKFLGKEFCMHDWKHITVNFCSRILCELEELCLEPRTYMDILGVVL